MLYKFAAILIVAWLLGFIWDFTMGGLIHVLLGAAVVLILVQHFKNKKN